MTEETRYLSLITELLQPYVPLVRELTGDDMSLERMLPLLEKLGNPHEKLKIIHVAGTSGKTSTCYYLSHLLSASSKKVCLTVSPHIATVTERLQLQNQPISAKDFYTGLQEVIELRNGLPQPSYFELILLVVFWYAANEKVDYLVLETGMGGLFDATNVAQNPDKVCAITDIGLDHMHVLGHTHKEIAAQKAGIIHQGNHAFCFEQRPEVMQAFRTRIKEVGGQLHVLKPDAQQNSLPRYQQRNFSLASQVAAFVAKRDEFTLAYVDPETIIVPGRMETVRLEDGSVLIADGAHNQQKMVAFAESFMARYPDQKAVVLVALKEGKEYKEVLDELAQIASHMIFTSFSSSQDLPVNSIYPDKLSAYATKLGIAYDVEPDLHKAYRRFLNTNDKLKVVTGSFYLLSEIKKL